MLSSTKEKKSHKNDDEFVHFQKINIFGEYGVGKTSLISHIENFNNDKHQSCNNISRYESEQDVLDPSIVEQVKRVIVDFNKNKNLYFTIYETNINDYDSIKDNLDILLIQTECILIIWDSSNPESFDKIPNLVSLIEEGIKDNLFRDAPIIVIQNKMDLIVEDNNIIGEFNKLIEDFRIEHPNILYVKISLLDKDKINDLIMNIYKKMEKIENDFENNQQKVNKDDVIINNVKYRIQLKDINTNQSNETLNTIYCTILGDSTVGKTTFIDYLLSKEVKGTLPTIGISKNTFFAQVYKEKIYIRLVDTAGQERYNAVPFSQYKNSDAILLFFDVTNEESFKKINNWIENIKIVGEINKHFTLYLVANKIDSIDNRKISKSEGKELADEYNIKYYEISCLKGINVYELFNEITFMAYKKSKQNCRENYKSIVLDKNDHYRRSKKKCC